MLTKYQKLSVLVVDGTDNIRTAILRMLREMGFNDLHQAKTGREALSIVHDRKVDLVISEWKLSNVSGKDLLLDIRQSPETQDIPFIVSTSNIEQATVIEAVTNGASGYLAKPFSYQMLKQKIHKAIVNPLHKNIGIKSKLENKATPVPAEENTEQTAEEPIQSTALTKENYTVLIVDDEVNNIEIASKCIKPIAKVKATLSGKKALQICKVSPPDLILLDIMMPEIDGYQVLAKLQDDIQLASIPVIFLTAKDSDEDVIKGISLGAVDYISKPFNFKILEIRVLTQLKAIAQQRALELQIDRYIAQFSMKENVDRILINSAITPLNSIDDSVKRINRRSLTSKQLAFETENITIATRNIRRLTSSLMTVLKLEDENFRGNPTVISLHALLSDIIKHYQKEQFGKSMQVDNYISFDTHIIGDVTLIHTMFTELYINALEQTPRGARVAFFEKIDEENGIAEITVFTPTTVDSSIKVSFFEKYTTNGKPQGTGLGTYCAKLIADICGEGIELDAKKEETRITVKLKLE